MSDRVHIEAFFPHPIERVWRALTDSALIGRWLMKNDFEARVGARFTFRHDPAGFEGWEGIVRGEVLVVVEPTRLVYSWEDTWSWAQQTEPTRVEWRLERVPGGTRVTLDHTGFQGPGGERLAEMLAGGWGTMMRELVPALLNELAGS